MEIHLFALNAFNSRTFGTHFQVSYAFVKSHVDGRSLLRVSQGDDGADVPVDIKYLRKVVLSFILASLCPRETKKWRN